MESALLIGEVGTTDTHCCQALARGKFIPVTYYMLASILRDGTAVMFDQLSRKTRLPSARPTHLPASSAFSGVKTAWVNVLGLAADSEVLDAFLST